MESILHAVADWTTTRIAELGYWGIIIMMGIESACIPLPSEIIMPFGGYLVSTQPDTFSIWGMGVSGALGCVWGSIVAYFAGKYGGRPFIERYGKYVLIRRKDLDRADEWFTKHGDAAVFFGRLLPVVRTFISFPAGMSRVRFGRFVAYTFLGSLPWCLALAYAGKLLGDNWKHIGRYFHGADVVIGVIIVAAVALYIYHHIRSDRHYTAGKRQS